MSDNADKSRGNRINSGTSTSSADDRIEILPEIEKLTEEILRDAHIAENTPKKQHKPKKTERKNKGIRPKFIIKAAAFVILTAVVGFAVYEAINIMNIFNSVNYVSSTDYASDTDLLVDRAYIQANVSHSDETKNIMLLGCDVDKDGISRSDSMIILSMDHNHQKIKMTSLMRDMYLRIPNNGKHKLNAAYVYGGGDLLLNTIYSNFGLKIDNYICVDYTAFAEIVDYIGGLDIYIDETELEQFNKYVKGKNNKIDAGGRYHFNGQQTLSYCRIRKVGTDTARTARQRDVLNKIIKKCKGMSLHDLQTMMKVIAPKLSTNFTQSEMLGMLLEGFSCINYDTMQMRIPMDGTWEGKYINKIWYMKFDLPQNAQYLNDFIYGDDEMSEALSRQLQANDQAAQDEIRANADDSNKYVP